MFVQLVCVRKQLEIIKFLHHGHTRFNRELVSSRAPFTLVLLYSDTSYSSLLLFVWLSLKLETVTQDRTLYKEMRAQMSCLPQNSTWESQKCAVESRRSKL